MKVLYAVLGGVAVVTAVVVATVFGFRHGCTFSGTLCEWRGRYHDAREPYITNAQFSFMAKPGEIVYPWAAMARELEGSVDIKLTVAADGTIAEREIIRSSGYALLDDAALEATETFEVATDELQPSGSTELVRITFVMPEAPSPTATD